MRTGRRLSLPTSPALSLGQPPTRGWATPSCATLNAHERWRMSWTCPGRMGAWHLLLNYSCCRWGPLLFTNKMDNGNAKVFVIVYPAVVYMQITDIMTCFFLLASLLAIGRGFCVLLWCMEGVYFLELLPCVQRNGQSPYCGYLGHRMRQRVVQAHCSFGTMNPSITRRCVSSSALRGANRVTASKLFTMRCLFLLRWC
jgi:hypothetical protein